MTNEKFGAQTKRKPQLHQVRTPIKETKVKSNKKNPTIIVTEFGDLLNIKPMSRSKLDEPDYREVKIIGDNTNGKDLLKILNHNPKLYFLFDPKGHFVNAQTLYYKMKKLVNEQFYGTYEGSKKLAEGDWKETPFEKAHTPEQLFNVNRRVKMSIKQQLSRFGFLALRDGSIEINEKERPEIADLKSILLNLERGFELRDFEKRDFFAPFPFMEGVISAESMKTSGIKIQCLQQKMIYPLYGVFAPTQQDYLELVANYLKQSRRTIGSYSTLADLGTGTGILPILAAELGDFKGRHYTFDRETNAIESCKMNFEIFGHSKQLTPIEIDLLEFYNNPAIDQKFAKKPLEFYKSITEQLK